MNEETTNTPQPIGAGLANESGNTALDMNRDASVPAQPNKASVIGSTLVFKGDLTAGEDLVIQGRVEGSISHTAQQLTIGAEGTVKADIKARNIIVEGEVTGDMHGTESVGIRKSAKVKGNIFSPRVGIDEGAHFKGGIDMDVEGEG